MGLLLSILVFSVGVLEALACVRHIQQGILPAWAPRHVTSSSGRRLLREHWRKSTSLDDASGDGAGPSGDAGALPNGAPSRRHAGDRKGSLDDEQPGRPRPPPLTLGESPHHVRSPDIHWPEPVPHSPAKHIEQTLPSPVAEVPGDAPTWPGDAAPTPPLQRRRTSTTETLPHEEQGQAEPLRAAAAAAAPQPSFAREAREPPRNKPAKASSFEEAHVQTFAPKAPEVASVNHHAPAPRAALVHSIEVTSSAQSSLDDAPAPWPIVNIDTVATSDEEGDVSPTSNLASRRVSFDPVPTVVVIDNEKPIIEERERGTILAPSIRITDDLESVLRKELPSVIDDIIQQALVKVNEVLESRQNGPLNGVSLLIENLVSKSDKVLKGPMSNACAEEYKDRFEPTVQSVIELQKDMDAVLSAIPQENKLSRSKEESGLKHHGYPTPLENEVMPNTGLQKAHPSGNDAQISNASADQISSSAPAKKRDANAFESDLLPSEESNSEIEAGKAVLLDNSKLDNLSTSSEPVSQTNVQNSIQDVKNRLGNSEELIPESVSGSEKETTDETGVISNCVAEPTVIPNQTNSAPNSSQSLHDTTNENEIRNEMQGDDGSEERSPETTWKMQSPTAGESLILGDAAVATTAAVPAELGSIASTPASSAALPPSESREKAAPIPLASASECPVASAAPHIPSAAPEFPVVSDNSSESIPLDTMSTHQAIPNVPESSSPEIVSTSSTSPSPNVSIALNSPAASAAPEVQDTFVAPSTPVAPVGLADTAAAVAPPAPDVFASTVAPSESSVPAAPTTPSPAAPTSAVAPTAPTSSVAPTSPAAPTATKAHAAPTAPAVLPSPATPAASTTLSTPTIPDASPVASAGPTASAVPTSASPTTPAAPAAPASPTVAATPVADTSPPSPAVPIPAPASSKAPVDSSKARPASAAPQPPAPAPAVGAPLKEEEPSRAPSSSGRPAGGGGGRAAAPKVSVASAAPAPQPEAFWVSDASSSPAPHAHSSPPKATFTAVKKSIPVSQSPTPKAPLAPWTQKTSSAGSTKQPFSGFQKSVSAETAKNPQSPAFTKVGPLSKTPPSPTFVKKQFGAPAPTPVASFPLKPTSSPFGTKVTSSAPPPFYKPAAASTTPSFLANLTPKTSSAFNSRFPDSSPPVSEPIPRPPSPAPAPPVEKREESSSQVPPSPSPSSEPPPRPGPATPAAPGSSRPTSPPPRDPQEVVRRLAELRRTNPTVATEVLLSILGFKFPGS